MDQEDSQQPPTTPPLRPAIPEDIPRLEGRGTDSIHASPRRQRSVPRESVNFENESARSQAPVNNPQEPLDSDLFIQKLRQLLAGEDPEDLQVDRESLRHNPSLTVSTATEDTSVVTPPTMASSNAFPALDTSIAGAGNRSAGASPTGPSMNGSNGINGPSAAATAAYMPPLPVGHQQDLNHLFNQIQELGTLLRSNRDKVNSITKDAEEVAKRANGALNNGEDAGTAQNDKARIRELELELSKQKHLVELYKHEQKENTGLIALYEEAMGTAVEQIRNYCGDIEGRFLRQRKHYNDLLQAEKDEHLASRLDRDHWHAQTIKVCEMIRTAHRLRSEEWNEEYTIIAALQGEVRILRRVFDMEPQAPEEETGWPYLKDLPLPE